MASVGVANVVSGVVSLCVIWRAGKVASPVFRHVSWWLCMMLCRILPRLSVWFECSHSGWCALKSPCKMIGVVMLSNN